MNDISLCFIGEDQFVVTNLVGRIQMTKNGKKGINACTASDEKPFTFIGNCAPYIVQY